MAKTEAETQFDLANALRLQGRFAEAAAGYQRVLVLLPNFAEAHNNLGIVLKKLGRLDEAAASYRQALRIKPNLELAHNNLGNLYQEQGLVDQAEASYRQALHFNPNLAAVHLNLGTMLRAQGRLLEAVSCFRQVVRLQPQLAEGHAHLGSCLQEQGEADQAAAEFRLALSSNPDFAEAHAGLAAVLADQGDTRGAIASYQKATRLHPTNRVSIALATCLPVVYQSPADLQAWRNRLIDQIRLLHERRLAIDLTAEPADPLFFLAYQGLNDRDIMRSFARLYRAPEDASARPQPGGHGKIKVGFISNFFRKHTIGHWMRGLIARLSRAEFQVTVLSIGRYDDDIAGFIKQHADRFLEVPKDLPAARRMIAAQQLDVLFYTDIGMEPITYSLAFSRLAPVQCVTLGHPVTTGISTIDYYISAEDLETPSSVDHYTETLVRLKSLPIYYYRPQLRESTRGRSHFGLAAEDHVHVCLQSPFKFHPEFDEILGGILRGDGLAKVVLTRSLFASWETLLRQRFAVTLPDVVDRIRFLPMLDYNDYLHLLAHADAQLDPLYFGGGSTSYDGLAVGTPIVTMPSQLLRGRITFALCQQMRVTDCVAQSRVDYVNIALRLGMDADFRGTVRQKILAANAALFENEQGIRQLEEFLKGAVNKAASGMK